ncbi:MAG TPA: hypothetical protein VFH80_28330 [Solirubrobacteraceae bacterium]|nr:hypothetical protein [Solirubrobacteraceae bacterium]
MPATKKPTAAAAQIAEASDSPKTVEFKGRTFTLPDKPEIGFFYESEQGHYISAVAELLGQQGFAQFRALRPTIEDFDGFAQQILDVYGLGDQGN